MDIRIGSTPPVGAPGDRHPVPEGQVEAKLLAVRAPRKRGSAPPVDQRERRQPGGERDPQGGRVLVLLIPDGDRLPDGIEAGNWRVFLRFSRR